MTLNAYGPVPFAGEAVQSSVRYTTVNAVKSKLQIVTDDWDDDIEELIVSVEGPPDLLNGRSLPVRSFSE